MLRHFRSKDTSLKRDAALVTGEYVRIVLKEGIRRSRDIAVARGDDTLKPEHLYAVLPQLLLDFT